MEQPNYLTLIQERKELVKELKSVIKKDIMKLQQMYKNHFIKNIEDFTESEIDEFVESIYVIIFKFDFEIVNLLNKIKELEFEQEIEEAKWHQQYPINQMEIDGLRPIITEYIKNNIPVKFQANNEYLLYYIYDILEETADIRFGELIRNINIKNNEICEMLS